MERKTRPTNAILPILPMENCIIEFIQPEVLQDRLVQQLIFPLHPMIQVRVLGVKINPGRKLQLV
jgi:hypothetical protein